MNVDHIKNIAYFKAEAEATALMIQDFDGTSHASISEMGCAAKTNRAPDSRMLDIIERRDRLRKQLVDIYEAYLQSVEWGMEELKSIEDPRMRTILILRFVQGYRWEQVARHLEERQNKTP